MGRIAPWLISIIILPIAGFFACAAPPAHGGTLFFDDFDGPALNPVYQTALPDAPWRYFGGYASYQGAAAYTFETVGGATTLRLQSILSDARRAGWSTSATFSTSAPITFEARFNTMTQSATTGIDQLLEIWLVDAANPGRYAEVELLAWRYGVTHSFSAMSSITGAGDDTDFAFTDNTWYRMVLTGSPTETVRASIYADDGTTELIGVDLGHTLSGLGSAFRIGLSQSMGLPGGAFPTNSAVDYLSVTTSAAVPEPNSFALLALGIAAIGLLQYRRPTRLVRKTAVIRAADPQEGSA